MPVIPVESEDWEELAMAVARLSIDPRSQYSTAHLLDELEGNVTASVIQNFGLKNVTLNERQIELVHRASYKRLATLDANRTSLRKAEIAGLVLFMAVRLAHFASGKASIGKAQKVVERLLENGPQKIGIKSIKAAWGRFKSISHFIAAPWLIPKRLLEPAQLLSSVRELEAKGGIEPIREKLDAGDVAEIVEGTTEIEELLASTTASIYAAAEKLRVYCADQYAPGQKVRSRPLVDPDAMWSIPSQFKLPNVELEFGPPLSAVELSVLKSRK